MPEPQPEFSFPEPKPEFGFGGFGLPEPQPEFGFGGFGFQETENEFETEPATESCKQKRDKTIDANDTSTMETVNNKTINNFEKGNTNNKWPMYGRLFMTI